MVTADVNLGHEWKKDVCSNCGVYQFDMTIWKEKKRCEFAEISELVGDSLARYLIAEKSRTQ